MSFISMLFIPYLLYVKTLEKGRVEWEGRRFIMIYARC